MKYNFSERQRLAYYLVKNHIYDAAAIRDIYLQSANNPHPVHVYETQAETRRDELEKEMNLIAASGVRMVFLGEKGFPWRLKDIDDGPIMLFVKSVTDPEELFNGAGKVFSGIVGTRDIDQYGRDITRELVRQLTSNPSTVIVSGLALGVDIEAHKAAIANGLPTIAVLPTGLDTVYPACHRRYEGNFKERKDCALVSPFAPGTEPSPVNCLLRNRVIAALCDNLTVTESKIKGGALVTAKYAAEYNRPVYAIPGRLGDVRSEGCNYLIKAGFAELINV